jgi:hypothetical protein
MNPFFNTPYQNFVSYLLFAIAMGIVLFVLLREFWCWYFKLNKIVNLLEEIRDRLPERSIENDKVMQEQK